MPKYLIDKAFHHHCTLGTQRPVDIRWILFNKWTDRFVSKPTPYNILYSFNAEFYKVDSSMLKIKPRHVHPTGNLIKVDV